MVKELLEHNVQWARQRVEEDPSYFQRLSGLQAPRYLWIGCSDSRVPANVITGLEPGEVFVHRNVANLVHSADLNLLSVLEFAVGTLGVSEIIVCGHYSCGGVIAAVDGGTEGAVDYWLQPIRDVYKTRQAEIATLEDRQERINRMCEFNVEAQVLSLSHTPVMQAAWARNQKVSIHGWIYGLSDGLLRDLKCGFTEDGTPVR